MNHTLRTIHKILGEWGRTQRAFPPNNDILKSTILEKLPGKNVEGPSHSFYRLPWLSFALTSLAVATLFLIPRTQYPAPLTYSSVPGIEKKADQGISAPEKSREATGDARQRMDSSSLVYPEPRSYPGTPITDRREFLKTDYNATLRTRRIMDLSQRIQTIIRGVGGRVDASTASERWGYVAFAVPADRFESFRREIKSLAPARFIVEETRAENLLPQKRSIEEQEAYAKKTLADLTANRESVIAAHTQTIRSLQNRIAAIMRDLAKLRAEVTNDPQRKAEIAAEEQRLTGQIRGLEGSIAAENTAHANRLAEIDSKIKANETALESIRTQDKELIDTAATVEGHISLEWISIWEIIHLYIPLYWLAALFSLGAIAAFIVHRRRSRLIVL